MSEVELPPQPGLMESMRAVGYTIETAIADLVDNSVTANAGNVEIFFTSDQPDHLAIVDDGDGMTEAGILKAMQLASTNATAEREQNDLGRFGLGLKTASLSQCRSLTVVSKRRGNVSAYTWDLDRLAKTKRWTVIKHSADEIESLPNVSELTSKKHGTMILWQKLDILIDTLGSDPAGLDDAAIRTKNHLALVFHRYIDGENGRNLAILFNGRQIPRIDPFLKTNRRTQHGRVERISIDGVSVRVQSYTLPFVNKLTKKDRELAGLHTGSLRDSQGFYIYRGLRLVVWGTWFRLAPKSEMGRLARVQVDVPNSLDHLWALDIKKSTATPPPAIRSQLKRLVQRTLEPSERAHKYRGRKTNDTKLVPVWSLYEDRDEFRYEINREHPLVQTSIGGGSAADMELLLELVESTFPIQDAFNRLASDQIHQQASSEEDGLVTLAKEAWKAFKQIGKSTEEFARIFAFVEPFSMLSDPENFLLKAVR